MIKIFVNSRVIIIFIHRLSDESGKMECTLVSEGKISRSSLDSKDGECDSSNGVLHCVW